MPTKREAAVLGSLTLTTDSVWAGLQFNSFHTFAKRVYETETRQTDCLPNLQSKRTRSNSSANLAT